MRGFGRRVLLDSRRQERTNPGLVMLESSWRIYFKIGASIEAQVTARIIGNVLAEQGLIERSEFWLKWVSLRMGGRVVSEINEETVW